MNKDIRPDKSSPAYLKKTKSGGLLAGFLYVLLFMSILGLGIWQSFESSYTESKIKTNEDRLAIIEEQMNIADEINNDSMSDISSSIQFLDKEVRKLWDLSNKRNKVNISKLLASTSELEAAISGINESLDRYRSDLSINTKMINDLEPSIKEIDDIQLALKSIETQLILVDDSVQALNNYKRQLNQSILEIQTELSTLKQLDEIAEPLN
jgi:predicted  nucleic acid-binding Zn-ribbon protein|tara:strand:+ start:457 stop:1086 length:630 start_codon:yes stop_codon:yes gene_type:complete